MAPLPSQGEISRWTSRRLPWQQTLVSTLLGKGLPVAGSSRMPCAGAASWVRIEQPGRAVCHTLGGRGRHRRGLAIGVVAERFEAPIVAGLGKHCAEAAVATVRARGGALVVADPSAAAEIGVGVEVAVLVGMHCSEVADSGRETTTAELP